MITDWKPELAVLWSILQQTEELDTGRVWQYHLPRAGATREEIEGVSRRLGFALDARYANFLRYANGWPDFYQSVDLFGTGELLGGALMDQAQQQLAVMDDSVWNEC